MTKVDEIAILDRKIVDAEAEGDGAGEMTEETGGRCLNVPSAVKLRDKAEVGHKAGVGEAVHRFDDVAKHEPATGPVGLDERGETDGGEVVGRERAHINFDGVGGREVGTQIEIRGVGRPEVRVFGQGGVGEEFEKRHGRGSGGGGVGDKDAIPASGAAHTTNDVRRFPLFFHHPVVIGGGGGRAEGGDQGTCVVDQLYEFREVLPLPLCTVGAGDRGGKGDRQSRG